MKLDETGGSDVTFLVRFHGVRGSFPVPRPGAAYFGGNTSCIEVLSGGLRVVLDLGTGLIGLGDEIVADGGGPLRALLLVSHLHHDHTMGFPFFRPVYDPRSRLLLAGPGMEGRSFQELLERTFSDPFFPVEPEGMASKRIFKTLVHGDAVVWGSPESELEHLGPDEPSDGRLVVRCFRNLQHPNGGVLNFRLERGGKSLVLATDVEGTAGVDGDLVEFARDTDLLIHDAQYTDEEYSTRTKGWGHSTWRMAAEVARQAQAGRLVLYHHDPAHDDVDVEDIERRTREKFAASIAASEGLEIRL